MRNRENGVLVLSLDDKIVGWGQEIRFYKKDKIYVNFLRFEEGFDGDYWEEDLHHDSLWKAAERMAKNLSDGAFDLYNDVDEEL